MSDLHFVTFVASGHDSAVEAIEQEVRLQVLRQYEPLQASAGWWRRLLLRWKAEREIRRKVEQVAQAQAPPDALY